MPDNGMAERYSVITKKDEHVMRQLLMFALVMCVGLNAYALPVIKSIGSEETCGTGAGRYPCVAVDTEYNPHVCADISSQPIVYFHDYINGAWRSDSKNFGVGAQYYNTKMEINDQNQAWISGVMWYPKGAGLVVRNNVNTDPTIVAVDYNNTSSWLPIADVSLNPRWTNEAVWNLTRGYWEKVTPTGQGGLALVESGDVGPIGGGEGHEMWVSKGDDFPHPAGDKAIMSFCTTMDFQNTLRGDNGMGLVQWVNQYAYNAVWSDHCYPNIVSDNDPGDDGLGLLTAYMIEDFASIAPPYGIYMNIWRPTDAQGNGYMQFSSSALLCIDANGSSGAGRYEPQLYPANKGGAWVSYVKGGYVWLCYVPKTTTSTADLVYYQICPGTTPDVCVDGDGNLHIAYNNGGIKYRKIEVTGDKTDDVAATDMSVFVAAFAGSRKAKMSVLGTNGVKIASGSASSTGNGTDFGTVSENVTHTFTVTNSGRSDLILGLAVTNGFTVSSESMTVGSKTSKTFNIVFEPTAAMQYNSTVTMTNNVGADYTFGVVGTGLAGNIKVLGTNGTDVVTNGAAAASALGTDFGSASENVTHTFTVTNSGLSDVVLGVLVTNGYSVNPQSMTVSGNSASTFNLVFEPTAPMQYNSTAIITNDAGADYTFGVTGLGIGGSIVVQGTNGVAAVTNNAEASADLGTDFGGQSSKVTNVFKVTNSGSMPLNITSYTWSENSVFGLVDEPMVIDPSTTSNLLVSFTPAQTIQFTASLSITNTSTNVPAFVINFSGTGTN